jgi:hypothetical protein
MNATTYGLDIAKNVFQLYWVDGETGEVSNRRFSRDELIRFLGKRPAGRVALEACASAHWWARKLRSLGHEPILLHARYVRPFVQTNKTDVADARAIWTAMHQPQMRTVAQKTVEQQAMLSLHRMRSLLVKFRTMQVNQVRSLLYEFDGDPTVASPCSASETRHPPHERSTTATARANALRIGLAITRSRDDPGSAPSFHVSAAKLAALWRSDYHYFVDTDPPAGPFLCGRSRSDRPGAYGDADRQIERTPAVQTTFKRPLTSVRSARFVTDSPRGPIAAQRCRGRFW